MKKRLFFACVALLLFAMVTGLVACNNNDSNGLTDPNLIKVKQAFDGVENSMSSSARNAAHSGLKMAAMTEGDALSAIRNIYESGDKQSNNSPELNYDEPPMRQFQYLKAIFEEMGNDFQLGAKYYYDIAGQMYFDMNTGYPVSTMTEEYLYNYVFGFALSIELKENDLIFAEVGFTINLTHGNNRYQTSWYVSFDLNYNFSNDEPTYTLLMYIDNKEGDLPYLDRVQGYEYDYVQMDNGAMMEWRKFVMETEKPIVIDDAHPSFDSYLSEGIAYSADTAKWYKNNEFYKITRNNADKMRTLATAYVDGLGMNTTSINAAAFLSKEGTENAVIDTYYKKICELYGGDVIYDLVCKKEDHYREGDDGGNGGDNGQLSSAKWNAIVSPLGVPEIVPAFLTNRGEFTLLFSEEDTWLISFANTEEPSFNMYCQALEDAGFTDRTNNQYLYIDEESAKAIAVAIVVTNEGQNAILITVANLNDVSIDIPYGVDFFGNFSGTHITPINSVKDIPDLDTLSHSTITANELTGLVYGEGYSSIYDITLGGNENGGTSEYAENVASEYAATYKFDEAWRMMQNNTLNYRSYGDYDSIVIITSAVENNEPHLIVYVLVIEKNTAESIVEGNYNENNNNGNGDDNGNNNGENEGEGEGEGQQIRSVHVTIYWLDQYKKEISSNVYTFTEGEEIREDFYCIEPGQKMFSDRDCNNPAPYAIASDNLKLFIWNKKGGEGEGEPAKGTFTIFDVTENDIVIPNQFDTEVGSGVYYGYSFEYLLYWDKSCTTPIALDYEFNMTEDGITVYRHIYEDYFALHIKTYINDHLYDTTSRIYRKEKVHDAFGYYGIVDSYPSSCYYDSEAKYYLGDGKANELTTKSHIATAKDEVTVSIYAYGNEHHVYTLKVGEAILTEDYIVTSGEFNASDYAEGAGHPFDYKNKSAEYCTVSGNVITMHNVTTLNGPVRVFYVWNGRIICQNTGYGENYFRSDDPASFIGNVGPSTLYFTDVYCNSPIILTDDGNGYGEYVVTGATDLYTPYRP